MSRGIWFLAALCASLLASEAGAQCIPAQLASAAAATEQQIAAGPAQSDRIGRVVASVHVNGQGPFRFIVDTGANRSALSRELAARLGLSASGLGEVHTVYGVAPASLVEGVSLDYGEVALGNAPMPVLNAPVLSGEQGLLGVDGMRGKRLRIDFRRNCIEIAPSRGAPRLDGWTSVRGRLRFGHLVVLEGRVDQVPVTMFVDTGSDATLANLALRDQLRARSRVRLERVNIERAYTAGHPIVLDTAMVLPRIDLGMIEASDIHAYVGDFHIFHLWELADHPALLVGMDVISQTDGVAIDYERATVHFRLRRRTGER